MMDQATAAASHWKKGYGKMDQATAATSQDQYDKIILDHTKDLNKNIEQILLTTMAMKHRWVANCLSERKVDPSRVPELKIMRDMDRMPAAQEYGDRDLQSFEDSDDEDEPTAEDLEAEMRDSAKDEVNAMIKGLADAQPGNSNRRSARLANDNASSSSSSSAGGATGTEEEEPEAATTFKQMEESLSAAQKQSIKEHRTKLARKISKKVADRKRLVAIKERMTHEKIRISMNRRASEQVEYIKATEEIGACIENKCNHLSREILQSDRDWIVAKKSTDLLGMWKAFERIFKQHRKKNLDLMVELEQKIMNNKLKHGQSVEAWNLVIRRDLGELSALGEKISQDKLVNRYLTNVCSYFDVWRSPLLETHQDLQLSIEDVMLKLEHFDKQTSTTVKIVAIDKSNGGQQQQQQQQQNASKRDNAIARTATDNAVSDKDKPCWNMERTGHCKFGQHCKFSHGVSSGAAMTDQPRKPAASQELCREFLIGTCSKVNCPFKHDQQIKGQLRSNDTTAGAKGGKKGNGDKVNRVSDLSVERCAEITRDTPEPEGHQPLVLAVSDHTDVFQYNANNVFSCSTSDRLVLMEDSGANTSVIRDVQLMDEMNLTIYDEPKNKIGSIEQSQSSVLVHGEGPMVFPFQQINAYYVPDATANVIAKCAMTNDAGFDCDAFKAGDKVQIYRKGQLEVHFQKNYEKLMVYTGVFESTDKCNVAIDMDTVKNMQLVGITKQQIKRAQMVDILHRRLNYPSKGAMVKLLEANRINDCKLDTNDVNTYFEHIHNLTCRGCLYGKLCNYPAYRNEPESLKVPGELIYWDEFHVSIAAAGKKKNDIISFALIKDGYSGYLNVFPVVQNEAGIMVVMKQVNEFYKRHGQKITKVKWDRLPSHEKVVKTLELQGLQVEFVPAGRHVCEAEVEIKMIKRTFTATLCGLKYKLPVDRYSECFTWIVESHNLLMTGKNSFLTPFELVTNMKIRMEDYIGSEYGALVVIKTANEMKDLATNQPLGELGVVIARDWNSPGSLKIKRLGNGSVVSRKHFAPFAITPDMILQLEKGIFGAKKPSDVKFYWDKALNTEVEAFANNMLEDVNVNERVTTVFSSPQDSSDDAQNDSDSDVIDDYVFGYEAGYDLDEEDQPILRPYLVKRGRSTRHEDDNQMTHRGLVKNRSRGICNASLDNDIKRIGEPAVVAVQGEIAQLEDRETWSYVEPGVAKERTAAGENIIPSAIFLKEKFDAFGNFDKVKARLVACGNYQLEPDGTIESPTTSVNMLLIVMEIAAREKMVMAAADIGGAYLYGEIHTRQLMKLNKAVSKIVIENDPSKERYATHDGKIVVELQKGLYGLKESAKIWYDVISGIFMHNNYKRSEIDKCSFVKVDNHGKKTIVILYVDDMLIVGDNQDCVDETLNLLKSKFEKVTVKKGDQISFIGLEIVKDKGGNIKLSQSAYAKSIVNEQKVTKMQKYPCNENINLKPEGEDVDTTVYTSLVMKLMYLATKTRPDILYVMCILSSSCKQPKKSDMDHLLRVVEYVNGTLTDGLLYKTSAKWNLYMSVDASFNVTWDAKGYSGIVIHGNAESAGILFKSMRQKVVADSSTEAELIALHEGVKHLLWVEKIYEELGYHKSESLKVLQDNQACILLSSKDPVNFKGRSKFINRKFFGVYEHVADGTIELVYTGTDEMVADFLTKAIGGGKHRKFKVKMMGEA